MVEMADLRVVCLCGSSRFCAEFLRVERVESLAGRIVLMPAVFFSTEGPRLDSVEAASLKAVHREKIRMADEILVVDVDGYVGDSTRQEIEFALSLGKAVRYWSRADQ
jgi:hypothetical protein